MNPKSAKGALILAMGAGLSACGYNVNPYGVLPSNVEAIRGQRPDPVSVAPFESYKPGLKSIPCRAAGPVRTADGMPFETYIEKAFIDELKLANAYDPGAPVVVKGRLEEIDFNSNIGAGKWMMKLSMSSEANPGYAVEGRHEFSTNWVADKACQQVAQAFTPAVQQLIEQVVSDPRFRSLTRSPATPSGDAAIPNAAPPSAKMPVRVPQLASTAVSNVPAAQTSSVVVAAGTQSSPAGRLLLSADTAFRDSTRLNSPVSVLPAGTEAELRGQVTNAEGKWLFVAASGGIGWILDQSSGL